MTQRKPHTRELRLLTVMQNQEKNLKIKQSSKHFNMVSYEDMQITEYATEPMPSDNYRDLGLATL